MFDTRDSTPLDGENWWPRIQAIGPDSILVLIRSWMSPELRRVCQPEDVLQETLLLAWRDRERYEWRGLPAFRAWVLTIARNRIRDLVDYHRARCRTPDVGAVGSLATLDSDLAPRITITPERLAVMRERGELIEAALQSLPEQDRMLVLEHLFAEEPMESLAQRLRIPVGTAWHRFRRASRAYLARLAQLTTWRPRVRSGPG